MLACASAPLAQSLPPGSFTAEQAAHGRAVYEQSCAVCHGGRFEGSGEAAPLAGVPFLSRWGDRAAGDFMGYIAQSMPPGGDRLRVSDATAVTAYLLQMNGHSAGVSELKAGSRLLIRAAPGAAPLAVSDSVPVRYPGAGSAVPRARPFPAREVVNFSPVTEETLNNPPPGDWLSWRRTRDAQAFSPLKQINKKNVTHLRLAWSIAASATQEPTPLVRGGVMYFTNSNGILLALDAASGNLIWRYQYLNGQGDAVLGRAPRNLAIFGDKLFLETRDNAMVAVDARTGKQVWRTAKPFGNSSGPMVADGVLIAGTHNCQFYKEESCFIVGYEPDTGKELWRTYTIAQPPDPNNASWAGLPLNRRAGGDTWIPGSYDSKLKTFFVGVAQAKPWVAVSRRMKPSDAALYTGSTLALDPHTGKIKWWFQHVPGESLDMDVAFERVLVNLADRPVLLTAGKDGIIWKLDRRTGAFVDLTETVYQDIFAQVDRVAGTVTYREDILKAEIGQAIDYCPGVYGGHNWPASAYSPGAQLLFLPLMQICGSLTPVSVGYEDGGGGLGALEDFSRRLREMPGSKGQAGRLDAYDVRDLSLRWSHTQRAPFTAGAVATAGGLVFIGDADRYFKAFDSDTGKLLWQTRLSAAAHGFTITYSVGSKQYVAVFAGELAALAAPVASLPDIYQTTGGNVLYVFELP